MLVKKMSYKDYKGTTREEEFYFNLSKAEATELELSHKGGLSAKLDRIIKTQDGKEIINIFKDLIGRSYGVVSDDGRRFIKSDELREEFLQTEAYSDLFVELATDADAAAEFVNGILPKEMKELPKPVKK